MAYAPNALKELFNQWDLVIPSAVFSGIVSSTIPRRGYHFAANQLPASDYSRQLEPDRVGIDPDAASALDVSQNPADMKTVTRRFYNSWKDPNDPRLNNVREVIGTLDGWNVIYMDCQTNVQGTSDTSHLWHNHIGVLRRYANDNHTMAAILSIVKGETIAQWLGQTQPEEDDDEMGATWPPQEIPVDGVGGGAIGLTQAGAADPRNNYLNIANDTFGQDYALRVFVGKGDGPMYGIGDRNGGAEIVVHSGKRWSKELDKGVTVLSIIRVPLNATTPKYEGRLTWTLERGSVIK